MAVEQQSGTANGAFYIYREYTNVPLVEGKTYRLEVDAYGSNGSFILMYHNNSWIGSTGSQAVTQQIDSVAGAWTPMSITFTATAEDVAAGKTRISLDVRNTWEGTMYFDNVRLIDVEAESASRPAPVELLTDNFDSGIAGWAPVSSAATLTQEDGSLPITKPATGACVIADSIEEVEEYLTRGYNYANWYLSNLYTSGDQEGFLYNSHQLNYLIEGMDHLARVTGNRELISHKYFSQLLVDWSIYFMAPGNGKLMPISDSQFQHYFFKTMSVLNRELGDGKAGFYLEYSKAVSDPFSTLLYTSMNPKIADAGSLYKTLVNIKELGYGGLPVWCSYPVMTS